MVRGPSLTMGSQMWAMFKTIGPVAAGLGICLVLLTVSQAVLIQMPWMKPALTADTSFDAAMQALQRTNLINSFLVGPAAAIICGSIVGLLRSSWPGFGAVIACIPLIALALAGMDLHWSRSLVEVAAYAAIAWIAGTLAFDWRGKKRAAK